MERDCGLQRERERERESLIFWEKDWADLKKIPGQPRNLKNFWAA